MSLIDFRFIQRLFNPTPIDLPIASDDKVDTALEKLQGQIDTLKIDNAYRLSGFIDRTQSRLLFNPTTRVLTIEPNTPSFSFYEVYINNRRVLKYTPESIQIPNTNGLHFVYFNQFSSALEVSETFFDGIITDHTFVSVIYWNTTLQRHIYFADERHGTIDPESHLHFHQAFGAQYVNGFALNNIIPDGSTSLDSSATFGVDNGVFRDEDLKFSIMDGFPQDIAPIGKFPILYRLGSDTNWFRTSVIDNFPVLTLNKATYPNSGGLPAYNYKSGANWLLDEVLNNDYFLIHVLATNDIEYPIQVILGNKYATLSSVRDGAIEEFRSYSGLPFTEFVLLATVIYQSNSTHTNTPKSRIISTQDGFAYVDWRKTTTFNVGGTGSTQNAIQTVAGDSGLYTAQTPTDTINIVGAGGVTTDVTGNTLTITADTGTQRTFGFFIS